MTFDITQTFDTLYDIIENDSEGRDFFAEVAAIIGLTRDELVAELGCDDIYGAIGYAKAELSQ